MGLQFNITYDSSVSQAPAGFEAAFAAAAQFYSSEFSDPITLNIHVGYGEVNGQALNAGNLGQSEFTNGRFYTYTQLEAALAADATSADDRAAVASLPATDPTNGGSFLLTRAEQKALGLLSGSDTSVDGYIGLSSADNFTFDPNNRAVAGEYDAIGAFEHEISEIMGRYGSLGQNFGNNVYEPLDLFRYSSPGVRDLAYGPGNFSINGQTLLTAFNDPDNGGDPGDWIPSLQGDSFGDGYQGVAGLVTPTDIRVMDILGYNLAPSANITFQNTDGSVGIWNMNGLNIVTTAIPANPGTSWHVIGNGDFAGAGKPQDILFQNTDGSVGIWEMNGLNLASTGIPANPGTAWHAIATGDFNGDGTSDILFQNTDGSVGIWEMNGLNIVATAIPANPGTAWHAIGTGDFAGDGKSDILFQNTDGSVCIWDMNGLNIVTTAIPANPGTAWHAIGTGDFNGDGKSDILFQNTDGSVGIWEMNGFTISSTGIPANPGTAWQVKGTIDVNGDGKSDILFQNTDGGVGIWEMNGYTVSSIGVPANPGTGWHLQS